jgi:hypothetical protein
MCIRRTCLTGDMSDHRKVFSGFKALMARTRRKDRYIACLNSQRPSLTSFELHLAAAVRDAES